MSGATPRAEQVLDVHLRNEPVGRLENRGPGRVRFQYRPETVERFYGAVLLSASMPVRAEPYANSEARPYFEGLLPEGAVRQAVARALRISEGNTFGLLEALGRDCAGAVVICPSGAGPPEDEAGTVRWLDDDQLAELVRELPRRPLGIDPQPSGVRLSLAGVQQKLVLVRSMSGRFGQPVGVTPSTHIVKPESSEFPGLAANEDFCQALGRMPSQKYETEGGPSVAEMVDLLRRLGGQWAGASVVSLVLGVATNFLLGNSDAHGKNFALLQDVAGGPRLAPLYDVVSTAAYPELNLEMAMSIGQVFDPDQVDAAAWMRLADEAGLGRQVLPLVQRRARLVVRCAQSIVREARTASWHHPVLDDIVATCQRRAAQLAA